MKDPAQTTVLLLDDERLLLDLYVKGFSDAGYQTLTYTSAAQALDALKGATKPDVILFDIHMPEIDGFTFLEIVKRDSLAPETLTIALTNESNEEDVKRILAMGAHGHFVKSQLSPTDLVAAVKGLLEGKK